MSIDQQVFDAAFRGETKEVQELVEGKSADINNAMMGASKYLEDVKAGLTPKDDERISRAKEICQWAMAHGACFLFSFTPKSSQDQIQVMKYSKNISMLKGPGDVAKGSFRKD